MSRTYFPKLSLEKNAFFSKLKSYVYVYCKITNDNKRIPIYIGRGTGDRCLQHLDDLDTNPDDKKKLIKGLLSEKKLDIDIIAYGLDQNTAKKLESACIELLGLDELTNKVSGQSKNNDESMIRRIRLTELAGKLSTKTITVEPEHQGCVILINKTYKPTFGDLELYEWTRGGWHKNFVGSAKDANGVFFKYAYAEAQGVVKEVYEIYDWIPAGTQPSFTRPQHVPNEKDEYEFVGKKASAEIRERYIGKKIERERKKDDQRPIRKTIS